MWTLFFSISRFHLLFFSHDYIINMHYQNCFPPIFTMLEKIYDLVVVAYIFVFSSLLQIYQPKL